MSNPSIDIDLSGLMEILGDDKEGLIQLLDTYICEGRHMLNDMESQLAKHDFDNIKRLAHSFKGMSATMGIDSLRAMASEMEQCVPNKDSQKAMMLYNLMHDQFGQAVIVLQ